MTRLTSSISCFVAALLAFGAGAADITVTSTADSGAGSLRQAIADALPGQEIDFAAGLSGQTITLTSGELVIGMNLTITGLGADQLTVSGNNNSRVFAVVGAFTVQISGLTLTNGNGAGSIPTSSGGAVLNDGGTLTISSCSLSDNTSVNGGAILLSSGTLTVEQSTISGNGCLNGGGIFLLTGTLSVSQCTFSGNSAANGGAIFLDSGMALVEHSTLAGNSAVNGGAVFNNGGTLSLANTILADSGTAGNYDGDPAVSLGYNLSDDNSAAGFLTGAGDLNNTPAGLDPNGLQDNGGPTRTIALELTSAAIDVGDPAFTPPPNFDQRGAGFPRVFNGVIDIGAFESQGQPMASLVLSGQHVTVHYHDKDAPGATDTNRGYTKAEIRGDVRFVDPGQISDDILSSLTASQVSVHVKAVLGGQTIADATLSLSVKGGKHEKWESAHGLSGPVEAIKIHWDGALKLTSKDSNPASPKIESKFIGLDTTDLRYEAKPGSYTTTLPNGVVVTVAAGKITGMTGLAPTAFEIADDRKRADLTLPYRLVPGMVFVTSGDINDTITATAGTNYTTVEAKFQLKLRASGLATVPLFNATPDTLQYEITLGTGVGEDPAFGSSLIGVGATLWDRNSDNHKKYNDDETVD